MPIPPLPDRLLVGTHPLRDWLDAGVTRRELAGPLWLHPSRGMYAWAPETDDLTARLHRVGGLAPPDGALGGWAAARLHGATDLDGVCGDGWTMPVIMCVPRRQTCRRAAPRSRPRAGVRVWRSDLESEDRVLIDGTAVTGPVRTGFDAARLSPTLAGGGRDAADRAEALVIVEALLRTGTVRLDEIAAYAAARPRMTGARQVQWVLQHAVTGTRSCQETRFRQLWTMEAGLPEPVVNAPLADVSGRFLAEVDLLDPETGLVGEYDGAYHAGALRRSADHARVHQLEQFGLVVVRVASPDLTEFRARTVHRLRMLYAVAREDRRPPRWQLLHRRSA